MYQKNFKDGIFDGRFDLNYDEAIGYDGILKYQGTSNGFRHYLVLIPQVMFDGGACGNCNGTGEDKDEPGGKCFRCQGGGREQKSIIAPAYHLAGTLELLLNAVQLNQESSNTTFQQLMMPITVMGHGYGVSGDFGPTIHQWLSSLGEQDLPEPLLAMKTLAATMDAKELENYRYGFRSEVYKNGGFSLSCEGNACYVSSGGAHLGATELQDGYELYCHNVDYVTQVLALLAGLAEIWRLALQQLYGIKM